MNSMDLGIYDRDAIFWHFISSACATAQKSYCRHAGVRRPSSVRRPWSIGETRFAKFGGKVPFHHISRGFFFSYFQNFAFLILLWLFFVFVNIGPYGRKNFKRQLIWNYITDSLPPKNPCILLGRVSTKVV